MSEIEDFFDLDEEAIHHGSIKENEFPSQCIIFLFEDDELAYVARTKNIFERLNEIFKRRVSCGPLSRLKPRSKLRLAVLLLPDPWGENIGNDLANYYVLKFEPRLNKVMPMETIEDLETRLRETTRDLESEYELPELEFFGD